MDGTDLISAEWPVVGELILFGFFLLSVHGVAARFILSTGAAVRRAGREIFRGKCECLQESLEPLSRESQRSPNP